jgi:2-dehydro-3-deoxyglucarate aldolase/4-hydroxy-2-oxoheptanedioate aldolase
MGEYNMNHTKFGIRWKQQVKAGELALGGHIFMPHSSIAEAMVYFGYKYLWIDGEHGAFVKEQILSHIVTVNGAGAGAFVRATTGDSNIIKPILEMGPDGIIIPMVCTAEQARDVIAACTYPPKGIRGYGPRRIAKYGAVNDADYLADLEKEDNLVKLIQIEHIDAVNNIDGILDVEGIDGVVVGPCDLSGSIGILAQLKHPELRSQCEKVIQKCKARHIPCGTSIGPGDEEFIRFWLDRKVEFLFCGDEFSLIKAGIDATVRKIM